MNPTRVIFGLHTVLARLRADARSIIELCVDDSRDDHRMRDLLQSAESAGVRILRMPGKRLDGMAGNGAHQGVVARVSGAPAHRSLDDLLDALTVPPMLLALDGVTDPHNLGACLRVADAAGVQAVIAPKDRAAGIGATVSKVASGAAETVPYFMVTNLARTLGELKERSNWTIGTSGDAPTNIYQVDLKGPVALVLGAEGPGMRHLTRKTCDELVSIPMQGAVESLNVSVASGVCLFEAVRQRLG
jgi:23S rRNA (guanosine2251-2'-O)-methyltransferase